MTKDTVIKLIKAYTSKLFNKDFDFNRILDDLLTLENWAVDDAHLLTWAEIDKIER